MCVQKRVGERARETARRGAAPESRIVPAASHRRVSRKRTMLDHRELGALLDVVQVRARGAGRGAGLTTAGAQATSKTLEASCNGFRRKFPSHDSFRMGCALCILIDDNVLTREEVGGPPCGLGRGARG